MWRRRSITQARILPGLTWCTSVEHKEFLLSEMKTLLWALLCTFFYSSPCSFISRAHRGSNCESVGLVQLAEAWDDLWGISSASILVVGNPQLCVLWTGWSALSLSGRVDVQSVPAKGVRGEKVGLHCFIPVESRQTSQLPFPVLKSLGVNVWRDFCMDDSENCIN